MSYPRPSAYGGGDPRYTSDPRGAYDAGATSTPYRPTSDPPTRYAPTSSGGIDGGYGTYGGAGNDYPPPSVYDPSDPTGATQSARNISSRERKYSCSQCQKRFERPSAVTTHMRSHTGEKPFQCTYCDKCFSINSNRIRHERTFHATAAAPGPATGLMPDIKPEEGEFDEEGGILGGRYNGEGYSLTSRNATASSLGMNGGVGSPYGGHGGRYAPTGAPRAGTDLASAGPTAGTYSTPSGFGRPIGGGVAPSYGGYGAGEGPVRGDRGFSSVPVSARGSEYMPSRPELVGTRGRSYTSGSGDSYDAREPSGYPIGADPGFGGGGSGASASGGPRARPGSSGSYGYGSDPSSAGDASIRGPSEMGSPSFYGSPTGFGPAPYDTGAGAPGGGGYGVGAATSNIRGSSYRPSSDPDYPEAANAARGTGSGLYRY